MKQSVNGYDFQRAFETAGRADQFSRAGLWALFEYLEEMEDGTGTEMELDVVALCCDYSEYASALEAAKEYGGEWEPQDGEDPEELEAKALDFLRDNTQVIEIEGGGVIVAAF